MALELSVWQYHLILVTLQGCLSIFDSFPNNFWIVCPGYWIMGRIKTFNTLFNPSTLMITATSNDVVTNHACVAHYELSRVRYYCCVLVRPSAKFQPTPAPLNPIPLTASPPINIRTVLLSTVPTVWQCTVALMCLQPINCTCTTVSYRFEYSIR